MSAEHRDDLVRRIAESYRAPEPTPAGRTAFRAALDARIRQRTARRRFWAPLAATAAAALVAVAVATVFGAQQPTEQDVAETAPEEALLALAAPEPADETLPDDYEAIADLLMGEV